MPTYETIFITLPNLSDEEESGTVGPLSQLVAERGVLVANDRMGRRRLAYPIKKNEDGIYTRFLYDSDPSLPRELERRLRISDRVLRHMTVRLEDDWAVAAKEQAVKDAQARAEAEAARAEALAAGIEGPEGAPEGRSEAPGASDAEGAEAAEAEAAPPEGDDRA